MSAASSSSKNSLESALRGFDPLYVPAGDGEELRDIGNATFLEEEKKEGEVADVRERANSITATSSDCVGAPPSVATVAAPATTVVAPALGGKSAVSDSRAWR